MEINKGMVPLTHCNGETKEEKLIARIIENFETGLKEHNEAPKEQKTIIRNKSQENKGQEFVSYG